MTSWLENLWIEVEATVKADVVYAENAVSKVFAAEKEALAPIIEEGLTTFVAAVAANPTPAGVAAAAASSWTNVASKLESTGITVATSTLVTSMTSGMAKAIATPTPTPSPSVEN